MHCNRTEAEDTYRPLWTMNVATTRLAITGLARMLLNSSVSFSGSTIFTCTIHIIITIIINTIIRLSCCIAPSSTVPRYTVNDACHSVSCHNKTVSTDASLSTVKTPRQMALMSWTLARRSMPKQP